MTACPPLNQQQPSQISSKSTWFHNIDGPTAESKLMQLGEDGSFLARPSTSTAGDYTLSVRRDSQVTHVKIQSSGEFFDLYGGDKFATLQELVEHYMRGYGTIKETNGRVIELKHPLNNEDNLQIAENRGNGYMPWFHKNISGVMAEQMLKEKGKQGSFLVRASSNQQGALVLCVLVDQQVLHIRIYYDNKESGYDVGGGQKFQSLQDLVDFYRKTPMVDKSGTVVHLKQPFNATRMTAAQIYERIQDLEKGQPHTGFWEEFEELQREHDQGNGSERNEGSKSENRAKNRFRNILPFDRTRVVLSDADPKDPVNMGDYINSNYIKPETSFQGGRTYIATQGPMPNTLSDFWRMVWQANCRIIVMTTKEEERAKVKCARYWPRRSEKQQFQAPGGDILVTNIEETSFPDYTLNRLEIMRESSSESRTVLHYQYLAWPDHNVPQDPMSVLRMLFDVNKKAKEIETTALAMGPVVVHCSAGIGRTGSVIIIDMLINMIDANGLNCDIDIQKLTHHVRSQRSGMVQTEGQYKFVYKAVHAFVNSRQQQQQQLQQQQQQQAAVSLPATATAAAAAAQSNGHDYTNLPPISQQQQQQQQQHPQQPVPAPAASDVPIPPPRQKQPAIV